jgi:hypothetical protein
MGKILTYLKISEDSQSRDVLDAERLLEGMQAIYASAPSGSKKDNFAIPLAEMTKVFIEKVKGIAPKEQPNEEPKQELNFKVGDSFVRDMPDDKDKFDIIYTIKSIDLPSGKAVFNIKFVTRGQEREVEREIYKISEDIDTKWWIPYVDENLPFKVGDKVRVTKDSYWYNAGNKRKGLIGEIIDVRDSSILKYRVKWEDEIQDLYEDYDLELAEQENYPTFKTGDRFNVKADGKNYQVIDISGDRFSFKMDGSDNVYTTIFTTSEANAKLKDGKWVKITDDKEKPKEEPKDNDNIEFKVGDVYSLLVASGQTTLTIKDVNSDRIKVQYADGTNGMFDLTTAQLRVKNNAWKKIQSQKSENEFNIGDKYLNKTVNDTFTIIQVYKDFIDVKFSGGNEVSYDMSLCIKKVSDGTWVKVLDEEKEETKEGFIYNVGDEFHVPSLDEYFKITEINSENVKFTYNNDGRMFNLTKEDFLDRVDVQKTFIPVSKSYKVGDKFTWAKEDMTFTLDFINKDNIGFTYSDGLTGFLTPEQFEKGLSTGYYKPYIEEAQPKEKKPRKPREPRTKSEQDKKIEHILDINLDEIQF